jgi:protein-S-isoprenylcysteine O-methyltransferase Ste14
MATILWLPALIFAQVIVIVYPGVLVFWLIIHNNIDRFRGRGTRAYRAAVIVWTATAGPLLFFRRSLFSIRWPLPSPFAGLFIAIGGCAFVLALVCLRQALKQIPVRTMVGIPEINPHQNKHAVLNSGVYSKTRNPIYLGHWLLVFAAAALTQFAANWILFVIDCAFLPLLIRAEERELLARYGSEFADYMHRVPRFFPRLR